ncbi:MAG TPA: YdeI/OmpD-associated family protein, partial [Cyclobacteriaceae bacterium]
IISKFNSNKEKTGWSYIEIGERQAKKLKPGTRVSFRVKGLLDNFPIQKAALLPMGDGKFILPFNATMRKGTKKKEGDKIKVQLELDGRSIPPSMAFIRCLKDDPRAFEFFYSLPKSHQAYFSKWIDSAKTMFTKTNRITMAVIALGAGQGYGEMIRANKKKE